MPQSQCDPYAKLFESLVRGIAAHIDELYQSTEHIPVIIENVGRSKSHSRFRNEVIADIVFDNLLKKVFDNSEIYNCKTCRARLKKIVMIAFMDKQGNLTHPVREAIHRHTGVDVYPGYMWTVDGIFDHRFYPYADNVQAEGLGLDDLEGGVSGDSGFDGNHHYVGFTNHSGRNNLGKYPGAAKYKNPVKHIRAWNAVAQANSLITFDEMKTIEGGKYLEIVQAFNRLAIVMNGVSKTYTDVWVEAQLATGNYPELNVDLKEFCIALRLHMRGFSVVSY